MTRVACGCMFMTDVTRQRDPESRAPQSSARPVAACRSTLRCGRTVGPGLFYFAASSLSLPRTSKATERAAATKRSQAGLHGQASTQPGPARAHVCRSQRIVHQRGGHPSVACAAAARARARAWVSRSQLGDGTCSWSIDSTVCCQTSSHMSISCSSPIGASQSEEKLRNKRIPPQE